MTLASDSPGRISNTRHLANQIDELEKIILAGKDGSQKAREYVTTLRQQIETEMARRDRILAAVNSACTRLIRAHHWHSEIDDVLRLLGAASEADRVAILQIHTDPDQRIRASLTNGWDRGGANLREDSRFQNFDLLDRGFGTLLEHFHQGRPFYFQQAERLPEHRLAGETLTSLNFPLFVNEKLWGALNFSMTSASRQWVDHELQALQISADIISATIERQRTDEALREKERLQLALEKEKELSTVKARIMRTISHEIRTPLTIITTVAGMLRQYGERMTLEQRKEKLLSIEKQVENLDTMVGEISATVRNLFDTYAFQPKERDLEIICQMLFTDVQNTLGRKHNMTFSSDGRLTAVHVDERLVQRILINLLSNAIKYSAENTEIQLQIYAEGSSAVLEVRDHGIGIASDDQQHLFTPFFRASNVGDINGSGLGLSIVQDCVQQHHGQISVQSQIGQGSTFTVRLPITPV